MKSKICAKLIACDEEIVSPHEVLLDKDVVTLGRSQTCDVVVNENIVSRLHAKIELLEGERYKIYDAESANGIFINEQRIHDKSHLLQNNDRIGLGSRDAVLLFRDLEATVRVSSSLEYNSSLQQFFINNQPLELPPREYDLLKHLYNNAFEVCTKESCIEAVWPEWDKDIDDPNNLTRLVSNLRNALQELSKAEFIITHRGKGYRLVLDPKDPDK